MKFSLLHNLRHSIMVIVATLAFGFMGFVASSWFFLGRELAQAEYRAIKRYYDNKRANAPEWVAFDYRVWDAHSFIWNLTVPILLGVLILLGK